MADAASALRKLTGGQTLTNEERALLNMAPVAETASTGAIGTPVAGKITPVVTMGSPATDAFVGPIPTGSTRTSTGFTYPTAVIYDTNGNQQTVFTSGPNAGRTSDGTLVMQGDAPVTPKPGKKESNRVTNADGSITVIYDDGSFDKIAAPEKKPVAVTGTENARTILAQFLADSGMNELAAEVWSQWNKGTSPDQIIDYVRGTDQYAKRYPGIAALRSAGRSISEAQYVAKEQADIDLMTSYGIPTDVATNRKLLGNLIANNVNVVDLQKRLIAGQDSIMSKDKNILKYAEDTFGLTSGDLMAFVLAPEIATPVIEQKAKAIQIGGAAFQASQKIAGEQAMALAAAGVTGAQAQQGFGNIAQQTQLTQALPGDVSGSVTNEELINAQFGMSPEALAKAKKVAGARAADYQAGGQYVSSQAGVTGLGSAPQV